MGLPINATVDHFLHTIRHLSIDIKSSREFAFELFKEGMVVQAAQQHRVLPIITSLHR